MYFEDTCLNHDWRTLRDIGISHGSTIDFCVDGEITSMRCHFGEQLISRNRSERCLVLDVCQDICIVWALKWDILSMDLDSGSLRSSLEAAKKWFPSGREWNPSFNYPWNPSGRWCATLLLSRTPSPSASRCPSWNRSILHCKFVMSIIFLLFNYYIIFNIHEGWWIDCWWRSTCLLRFSQNQLSLAFHSSEWYQVYDDERASFQWNGWRWSNERKR